MGDPSNPGTPVTAHASEKFESYNADRLTRRIYDGALLDEMISMARFINCSAQ